MRVTRDSFFRIPGRTVLVLLMVLASGLLNQALAQNNPPAVEEAIHQVYQAALEHEMKEVGKRIIIVDASMGKTNFTSAKYDLVVNDSIESVAWKQELIKAKYLDQELVSDSKKNEPDYRKLVMKKSAGKPWYELWIPQFTEDRKVAAIEMYFNRATENRQRLYHHFVMLLQWKNGQYEFLEYITFEHARD